MGGDLAGIRAWRWLVDQAAGCSANSSQAVANCLFRALLGWLWPLAATFGQVRSGQARSDTEVLIPRLRVLVVGLACQDP